MTLVEKDSQRCAVGAVPCLKFTAPTSRAQIR